MSSTLFPAMSTYSFPLMPPAPSSVPSTSPFRTEPSAPSTRTRLQGTSRTQGELAALNELSADLSKKFLRDAQSQKEFLPCDGLGFVDHDYVMSALKHTTIDESQHGPITHRVLKHGTRLFLTLLQLTTPESELLSSLQGLMSDGFDDGCLPLAFSFNESYGRCLDGTGPTWCFEFNGPKNQTIDHLKAFLSAQQLFTVPQFDLSGKSITRFTKDHALPFLSFDPGANVRPTPHMRPAASAVIHPSHLAKDRLQEVGITLKTGEMGGFKVAVAIRRESDEDLLRYVKEEVSKGASKEALQEALREALEEALEEALKKALEEALKEVSKEAPKRASWKAPKRVLIINSFWNVEPAVKKIGHLMTTPHPHLLLPIAAYQKGSYDHKKSKGFTITEHALIFPFANGRSLDDYWKRCDKHRTKPDCLQAVFTQLAGIASAAHSLCELDPKESKEPSIISRLPNENATGPDHIVWCSDDQGFGTLKIAPNCYTAFHPGYEDLKRVIEESVGGWRRRRNCHMWMMEQVFDFLIWLPFGSNGVWLFKQILPQIWENNGAKATLVPRAKLLLRLIRINVRSLSPAYIRLLDFVRLHAGGIHDSHQLWDATTSNLKNVLEDILERFNEEKDFLPPVETETPPAELPLADPSLSELLEEALKPKPEFEPNVSGWPEEAMLKEFGPIVGPRIGSELVFERSEFAKLVALPHVPSMATYAGPSGTKRSRGAGGNKKTRGTLKRGRSRL